MLELLADVKDVRWDPPPIFSLHSKEEGVERSGEKVNQGSYRGTCNLGVVSDWFSNFGVCYNNLWGTLKCRY